MDGFIDPFAESCVSHYYDYFDLHLETDPWMQNMDWNHNSNIVKQDQVNEENQIENKVKQVPRNAGHISDDSTTSVSNSSHSLTLQNDVAFDSKKSRYNKEQRTPEYSFKSRSDKEVADDGYKWRKYGKKSLKSSPHPRNYYKCSESNCGVKKRVEKDPTDDGMVITTYQGMHNHECPASVYYYVTNPSDFL